MAERTIREAHWGYYSFLVKAAEVCEKGNIAAFDAAGDVVNGVGGAGELAIGIWHETKIGDGLTVKVQVKLWREIQLTWWDNDVGTPVALTDRGKKCSLVNNHTVSMVALGVPAGIVFDVNPSKGVLVFFDFDTAP